MSDVKWFMQGKWLEYCSCDYGCPCETMAEPTYGHCDGVVAMKSDPIMKPSHLLRAIP